MANAPFTWGSQGPKSLQSGGVELANGMMLRNDGSKNYITYNDASTNTTTGWSLGNVALTSKFPSGTPTFGSGANANLSFSVSTSSPISNSHSYTLVSSAATTAGDFLASDVFTVDARDKAKVLTVKFSYEGSSNPSNANWSGTSSNSWGIALYDVTVGSSTGWIMPAGVWALTQSSGVGVATATFQTAAASTQYRLVIFNANATSGAATLKLDDFYVGPQTAPIGPVVTDWVDGGALAITGVTADPTFNSSATKTCKWRRVGDCAEIIYNFAQTSSVGTATGTGTYLWTLPSGLVIDTTKINTTTSAIGAGGTVLGNGLASVTTSASTTGAAEAQVYAYSSTKVFLAVAQPSAQQRLAVNSGAFAANSATLYYNFHIMVPISGWSSNVQMSNDTDTRVVAARYSIVSGASIGTSATLMTFATRSYDTSSSFSGTTYTCPVSGVYRVSVNLQSAAITLATYQGIYTTLYKNGSSYSNMGQVQGTGGAFNWIWVGSDTVFCNAGDTLQIYATSSVATTANTGYVTFERLSGPAVVAATETVACEYYSVAGNTIANNTITYIDFGTKETDSHAAVLGAGGGNVTTTNTGWRYIAPVSGRYQVNACVGFPASSKTNIGGTYAAIYKNGVQLRQGLRYDGISTGAAGFLQLTVNASISVNAGDRLEIVIIQNTGGTVTISNSQSDTNTQIFRIGN